jgi:hypothetical protein
MPKISTFEKLDIYGQYEASELREQENTETSWIWSCHSGQYEEFYIPYLWRCVVR